MMETIELDCSGPAAWIWLNEPQRLNAIRQATLNDLHQAFQTIEQTPAVRAVVVSGRGASFSSGFDVAWMAGQTAENLAQGTASVRHVYDQIEQCSRPVIAAVNGLALGGGLLLALAADIRLASELASFGAPEVKLGIFPALGLIPRLERVAGLSAAKRMVLTGEAISAAEAHRCGLVHALLSPEGLLNGAQEQADQLAALPAGAVQMAKAAFQAAAQPGYETWESKQFAACWALAEREQAMRAFLTNKRK